MHTRDQVLGLLEAGIIRHTEYDITIERIEKFDDVVVVMGSDRVVNAAGTPALDRRYTNFWRLEDGAWRMFARHANVVSEPRQT